MKMKIQTRPLMHCVAVVIIYSRRLWRTATVLVAACWLVGQPRTAPCHGGVEWGDCVFGDLFAFIFYGTARKTARRGRSAIYQRFARVIALFNNLNNAVRNRVAAPICRRLPGCGLRAGMIHKLPYFIPLFTTVHCVRFRPSILVGLGLEGLTAFCIGVRAVWTRRK